MSAIPRGPRDGLIDGLRGLAMLGVVAIHLAARVPSDHPQAALAQRADHLGRFGVPLFLMVLGVMSLRHYLPGHTGWHWLGRRLREVGWPYLVWGLLYAAVAPWDGATADGRPLAGSWQLGEGLWARLWAVVAGYSAEHLWYMPAYLTLVLLLPPTLALLRRLLAQPWGPRALAMLLLGGCIGQLALLSWIESWVRIDRTPPELVGWLLRAEGRIALQWLGFMSLGALLELMRGAPPLPEWLAGPRLVAGLAIHLILALRLAASPRFDDFWCSPAMFGSLFAFLLWAPVALELGADTSAVRTLRLIGRHSLAIYLSHVLWLRVGWWLAEPLGLFAGLAAATLTTGLGSWAYLWLHPRIFGPRP